MAWYEGIYSCGHDGRVDIVGLSKDRQRKADWHFSGLCPECYKKKMKEERELKNKEAAEKSESMELPVLIGTEKQVAWANTLRIKVIDSLNSYCEKMERKLKERGLDIVPGEGIGMKEIVDSIQYFIKIHTDAKYWIDTRDETVNLKNIVDKYKKHMEELANSEVIEEIDSEKESLTISPECGSVKNGVVKIAFKNSFLCAEYVKDSEFIEIVKGFGYKWNGTVWEKKITEYTGNMKDRVAELGNKLLNSGFTVQFPDMESKDTAISGAFSPENDRWVKYHADEKQLAIVWKKRSDTLYDAAKKLPGARWKDGGMRVNVEFYREVEDFADTMGFSISQLAKGRIEEYKLKEKSFETVLAKTVESENIDDSDRIRRSMVLPGGIIEDLIDE